MLILRPLAALGLAAVTLGGCAIALPPTQVVRYHLGEPIGRGTIAVQPSTPDGDLAPATLEFQPYAAAVQAELLKLGYTVPAAGAQPQYVAAVFFNQGIQAGPPRHSPISIGLGGGSFGGGRHGGGVGVGGGIGFPIGGGARNVQVAELSVTIRDRARQIRLWEGHARGVSDLNAGDAQPAKLAAALFTDFPGQSGRTIEVK